MDGELPNSPGLMDHGSNSHPWDPSSTPVVSDHFGSVCSEGKGQCVVMDLTCVKPLIVQRLLYPLFVASLKRQKRYSCFMLQKAWYNISEMSPSRQHLILCVSLLFMKTSIKDTIIFVF